MTERTTVRLPDDLLTRAKRKAANEGRTLTSLIEEGLRKVVTDPGEAPRERVFPRVSTAKGWLKPPFTDLRQVQEFEDMEYAERLKHLR